LAMPLKVPRIKLKLTVFFLVFILSLPVTWGSAKERPEAGPLERVPDALIEPGPGGDRFIVIVEKASQMLFLYEFKKGQYFLRRIFDCTTGENDGDKLAEGDRRTPEGFYIFNNKHIESELAPIYGILAYPMDYPNFWDQFQGKAGKGIWMHGTNRRLAPRDSNGCVALNNIDILNLETFVRLYETPIIIYDHIRYKDVQEINLEAARIKAFVEEWRRAWTQKNFRKYISMYSENFVSSDGKDYRAWKEHKSRLNELYSKIKVDLENLRIFRHQDKIVVLFDQYYRGDVFVSDGVKRLYLTEEKGGYKIAAEVWHPFPPKPSPKELPLEVRNRVLAEARLAAKSTPPESKPVPAAPDKETVRRLVQVWLAAWQKKDMAGYLKHYHPEFTYNGMDLAAYRNYKTDLAEKYKKITIKAEKMEIKVNGSQALVTFAQDYRSDQYRDYGLKTLVLVKHNEEWRIKEESWQDIKAGAKP